MGSISCWDIGTTRRMAYLQVPGLWLPLGSQALCMDIEGKVVIGGRIDYPGNLVAIFIDYRDRSRIAMSHVISAEVEAHFLSSCSGMFIASGVLGFSTRWSSQIVSWNMNGNGPVQTTTEDIHPAGTISQTRLTKLTCQPFRGELYLFTMGTGLEEATMQRLPLPLPGKGPTTPYVGHSAPNITVVDIPYSVAASQKELHALHHPSYSTFRMTSNMPHMVSPEYGIFAVTLRKFGMRISVIHFWPAHRIHDGKLHFGPACFYEHTGSVHRMAVGTSGTYVALMVLEREGSDGESYLGLLHFSATPLPHTTFRKLDTGNLTFGESSQIALDDALGLILVVDEAGGMTAISYV
ncbi:hypothetical protein C8R44DRAFT_808986 [Mycena epipterygia]|nr:hypothetical protein C8R44DRAFT_808986 [Mycena epipterygia]